MVLTSKLARRLYYSMLLIRRVEERIIGEYPRQEIRSPTHFYIGQEGVAAGVCAALRSDDLVFPYYRSHGWYLAKGGNLNAMMAELYGRVSGCSRGWGGSMHLIDTQAGVMGSSAIVAGMIPHAAGAALALKMKGSSAVAVVPFGDGATEEGVFHETMNMAVLNALPLVFVCENNGYATNTPISERRAQVEIERHARPYNMPSAVAEGNDVAAVFTVTDEAVARARSGSGPSLLVFQTYRLLEHVGPNSDDTLGYRTREEVEYWRSRGPLERAAEFLSEQERNEMVAEIDTRIAAAMEFALASEYPPPLVVPKSA